MRYILILFFLLITGFYLKAQTCTNLGQTPATAFPVCGTSVFHQTTVPICGTQSLYVPGCSNNGSTYEDKNPYWYKITCFQAGTLGFLIKPRDQGDDYDWQLYDITGHDPNDVFTNQSLIVTGNWAGTYGNTGASNSGVSFIQCGSDPAAKRNSFSTMPQLIEGHTYLLLISHFTDSQSGYDLSFSSGTAVITDTTKPRLKSADAACKGDILRLKLNKKFRCQSLTAQGTEFIINPGNISVTQATGFGCASGFDSDSIELQLSSILSPGTYSVVAKTGTDNNTLLDYCDNAIPEGDKVDFTVYPHFPVPMDSIQPSQCAPSDLHLIFSQPMLCSGVSADGSDFTISGSYPVSIAGAKANCSNNTTSSKEIIIRLAKPLYQAGTFTITLKRGSDGNTIVDECNMETPVGSTLSFSVKDTVNADFTYEKKYGCVVDTVNFFHSGNNSVDRWKWNLAEALTSSEQNPVALYRQFNQKNISLVVSNGFCSDTSMQKVELTNYLKADFLVDDDICPNEPVKFTSKSTGHITNHLWSFGDGGSSYSASPSYIYWYPYSTRTFVINYTVTDSIGCRDTAQKKVTVYSSCYLTVPNAFTPNQDGINDYLYPLNAIKATQLTFTVYNRWGQEVYKTNDWKKGWDGTIDGKQQPTGIYAWLLFYTDKDTGEKRGMRGTAVLIR